MISCLPKSQLKTTVESIERHLRAADKVASTACLTTGTADLTCLKTSPLPVIVSPVKSSTTRKRGPPTPAKQKEEGDDYVILKRGRAFIKETKTFKNKSNFSRFGS